MKIENCKLKIEEKGEIATALTILSFVLMLAGVVISSVTTQKQTRLLTKAADQCTTQDIIDKKYLGVTTDQGTDGCVCDETNKQKVVMHKSCDCAATGACPYVYPEKDNNNYCSGKITCRFENPSVTAKPAQSSCPTGQWSCKGQCADQSTQEIFNNTWCNGEKRWLYEAAGSNADCQGDASIPKSSTSCTGSSSSSAENPTKAPNAGGFHLTSDIYAEKATDGIKFNVHAIFNFDGCDGDVTLFRDGTNLTGYNGWKGPGAKDYDQNVAGSFTLKKGESISPGYKGTVDRCPKSKVTLEDTISCKLAVDYSGNPGVFGAGCTFKDQANFPAYNPAAPTLGAPSGPGGKYRCQDLIDSPNKDCNDTLSGPCEYGTYKYKCTSNACPSDKSVGVGIPFWCDGDKWYDLNKLGECTNACTAPGATAPTPSSECQGKTDGFVISSCTQQECETTNKKWINLEKVCQGGIAYTKPGKLSSDTCNPSTDRFRACTSTTSPPLGGLMQTCRDTNSQNQKCPETYSQDECDGVKPCLVTRSCSVNAPPNDWCQYTCKDTNGKTVPCWKNQSTAPPPAAPTTCKDTNKSDQPCPATYGQNDCAGQGPCVVNRFCGLSSNNVSCIYICSDPSKTRSVSCWAGQPTLPIVTFTPTPQPGGNNQSPTCSSLGGQCMAGIDARRLACQKQLLSPPANGCPNFGPVAFGCYECPKFQIPFFTSSTNQAFQAAVDLYSQQKVTAKDISEFVSKLPNNSDLPAPHIKYCDPTRGECNLPEGPQPGAGAI